MQNDLPIPPEVFKHPVFIQTFEALYWKDCLYLLEEFDQLIAVNNYLRGAAELTLEYMYEFDTTNFTKALKYNAIARLIWTNNWRELRAL